VGFASLAVEKSYSSVTKSCSKGHLQGGQHIEAYSDCSELPTGLESLCIRMFKASSYCCRHGGGKLQLLFRYQGALLGLLKPG